jgi:hypothetical protein
VDLQVHPEIEQRPLPGQLVLVVEPDPGAEKVAFDLQAAAANVELAAGRIGEIVDTERVRIEGVREAKLATKPGVDRKPAIFR